MTSKVSRRKFLTAMGVGGAALAAAVVTQRNGEIKQAPAAEKNQGRGYRLTEHVRRYYETAKV